MDRTHQNPKKKKKIQTERKMQVQKNGPTVSETGGQIEKIEILIVISFAKGTLRTVSNNGERLKNQLIMNLIQKKMLIYQHFFSQKANIIF